MAACVLGAAIFMQLRLVDRLGDLTTESSNLNMNGIIGLMVMVPIAATVFARRRYRESIDVRHELARLSLHDALTGLPNRLYLQDWLFQELREADKDNAKVAVLFIDLDRFKLVNDTYGHEVGDHLMVEVANRLRSTLRDGNRVLRYGGDEFVAICPDIPNAQAAERIADRLIASLEAPFTIGQDAIRISASIGVALTERRDRSPDEVLRDADVAMYHAKAEGVGRYVLFDRSMRNVLTPATAEARLAQALEKGEFVVYYQPVVDMANGNLVGVEALIRWNDPERGLVPPADFLPIMEETGLIVPVGAWVLEEVCRQAQKWRVAHPDRMPLKVTVNVSARQLAQVNFKDTVTNALRSSGVEHSQICLEITEGALMFDVTTAWSVLRFVKNLGVKLALDDFGTGYSSLSYVRRFRLDILKIDKSFVDGLGESPEDRAIVEHVIAMSRALGMVTVSEGVEHPEQLQELRALGGELAQGYLFSQPVPAANIDAMLADPHLASRWMAAAGSPPPGPAGFKPPLRSGHEPMSDFFGGPVHVPSSPARRGSTCRERSPPRPAPPRHRRSRRPRGQQPTGPRGSSGPAPPAPPTLVDARMSHPMELGDRSSPGCGRASPTAGPVPDAAGQSRWAAPADSTRSRRPLGVLQEGTYLDQRRPVRWFAEAEPGGIPRHRKPVRDHGRPAGRSRTGPGGRRRPGTTP